MQQQSHQIATRNGAVTPFKSTGLERGSALASDIDWLTTTKGLSPLPISPSGPGSRYVDLLHSLARDDVPSFMCHYYNIYFAHTAGGAMIGRAVSEVLLDGMELQFYKYKGDSKELGNKVKADLEAVAQAWAAEARERSVAQTGAAFTYMGSLLKCITQACECDCPRQVISVTGTDKELVAK
jgi:heme oxygenase (biliverdin-producing, ferredoxin)